MPVKLRPLKPDDSQLVLSWRNRPHVAKYMYSDHAITEAEHISWFARILGDSKCLYWIIQDDDTDIGLCNLYDIHHHHRRCSWAFYLAESDTRGRGVGAAVEYLVLKYVFGTLKLHKLCCEVFAWNHPVVKLHERFGFVQEGVYRDHIYKDAKFHDVIAMALLSADWQERQSATWARLLKIGLITDAD